MRNALIHPGIALATLICASSFHAALVADLKAAPNPYTAQEILTLKQKRFDRANDLHVKFWQREDDIHITDWTLGDLTGLPPATPPGGQRGSQPPPYNTEAKPPGSNPDDGSHAVDFDWDDLDIARGAEVKIPFSWVLTEKNTKHVSIKWTKRNEPARKAGPKNGWLVDPPKPQPAGGFIHRVYICNLDDPSETDAETLNIAGLSFGVVNSFDPLSFEQLDAFNDWTPAPLPSQSLAPGTCSFFDVFTELSVGHILGTYDVLGSPTGGSPVLGLTLPDDVEIREVFDHPTPEPTAAMCLGLTGILLAHRRR